MKFTYIVHLIKGEGNDISAMNLSPAGRDWFFFFLDPLSGDVGMAAAEKHEDC